MDLAIGLQEAAIAVDHGSGVVVIGHILFEDGYYYHDLQLSGQPGEGVGGWTRNCLCQMGGVPSIPLGKVARPVKLLQADDLRAPARRFSYPFNGLLQVLIAIL